MVIRKISPELEKIAKEELNEVPDRIDDDLKTIKEWIGKQAHLNARLDDQWLISFLRGCKYSLERTKEKIDMFYSLKNAIPEVCTNLDPMNDTVQEILKSGFFLPLPKPVPNTGVKVMLVRPGRYDATKHSVLEATKVNYMSAIISLLEDDNAVIFGEKFIIDLAGVTMNHFVQMTPVNIQKMVKVGQDGLPFRLKGNHHINVPPGSETIFSFFKLFMNVKNRERIFIHGSLESLYDEIPKEILPNEYGGNAGSEKDMIENWKKKVESYREWFLEESKYNTDERKRIGTPKTAETLFGVEGSFRKLDVD